jgi:hypothetical protein
MADRSVSLDVIRNAVIVPYTDLLDRWRDGEIHRGGPIWPDWDSQGSARHHRAGRPVDVRPADPHEPPAEVEAMAWGGAIVDAFGHQVADFTTRLLATASARLELPIAFASRPDLGYDSFERAPGYFRALLDWFGVPAEQVRVITAPTLVHQLYVAPQAEQLGGPGPDAAYLDALDALAMERLGELQADDRLLYVSRAGVEARFAGEAYLEEVLEGAGVRVLRPETLPLVEQLRTYAGASHIVFAEGSALHALQLLGRLDAQVAVFERRPGTRLAEANLRPRLGGLAYEAVSRGLIHGLLPTGRPALPHGLSVADPERLRDAFARAGADPGPIGDDPAWAAARDEDVRRWLEAQVADPSRSGPGSVEHILEGLDEAGLGSLAAEAADRLEPLRATSASSVTRDGDRPTLLFMHIPRTGGGAVREALHTLFPEEERRDVYDHANVEGTLSEFAFLTLPEAERARLSVVVGDFAFGFHRHIPGPARYAVMLRHPISRILSLYRAVGRPRPSLESWVFDDRRIEADNAMVRAISGRPGVPFGACPDDMLEEAIAHIETHFEAVLMRSSMTRSAVLLGRALGRALPPMPVVNADPDGEDSYDAPKALRKELRQLNRLDVALFKRYAEDF